MNRLHLCILFLFSMPSVVFSSPKAAGVSTASITVYPDKVICPLENTLFGMNITTRDKANMAKPEFIEKVKKLGIKSCRFPNGCQADLYNWKSPAPGEASVEEFLTFCDAIDAEAYYTINIQGGTEGLKGPAPEGLPLEEKIKYQHLMPNPCGYTNYHYGTLAETLELVRKYTVERALAGKRPILHYEMGNENWGQSRTDWPPEVYARTVEVYAREMRRVLEDAKKEHPELEKLNLYIVAVGYPVMGNNMKMVDTPDRTINVAWTGLLNKLYRDKLIDAVQEHFYPQSSANGGTLVWAAHNLHNIIHARKGIANPRLNGYKDPAIAYEMPMEFTEWNIKCWGPVFKENLQPKNSGFESGLDGWNVKGSGAKPVSWAARRGSKGLRVVVSSENEPVELSQAFDKPEKVRIISAGVWVRTDKPEAVKVELRQADDGENRGRVLGGWASKVSGMWERVVVGATMKDEIKKIELILRVEKPATVYFDEVKLYCTTEERGTCPISAHTFEQQLFCVDALRAMAVAGSPRTHLHHLVGNYACGAMTAAGEMKDNAKVYELFAGYTGSEVVKSDAGCESFRYCTAGNPWATDFNALAPDRDDVPMLGSMVSRKGNMMYILLINRTSDRDITVDIDLGADPAEETAMVRRLSGTDIDVAGAELSESSVKVGRKFTHTIAPYSAEILAVGIR